MSDGARFALGAIAYLLVQVILIVLLVREQVRLVLFLILEAASTVILLIPMLKTEGSKAEVKDGRLKVRAFMVNLDIPLSSITAVECRDSFKPGMKIIGYAGIKKGSGDFKNAEFPSYTFAGDARIAKFVLIRYGKDKVAVFNSVDEAYTTSLYVAIKTGTNVSSKVSHGTDETAYSKFKRNLAIGVGIVVVLLVAMVAVLLNTGHVDAHLDDDALVIDATMMRKTIAYTDIESVELRDEFDAGTRVGGFGGLKVATGNFRNDEFGTYKLAIHSGMRPVIVVHCTDSSVVVFDAGSPDGTRAMFEDLQSRIGPTGYQGPIFQPCTRGSSC